MSAKVGRVGYVFKGDYNNLTEYSRLNCVKYTDGNIYVAKGDTVGNLPTNSTYWDLFLRGVNNASDLAYDNSVSGLTADDVQEAIDELASEKQDNLTFDASPTEDSTNPVTSGGVYTALGNKQDTLTFDNVPTENSTNPVKSGGVYSAIEDVQDYAEDITAVISANGAKNLLPNNLVTQVESGITFTVNADKSVTISGTASANIAKTLCEVTAVSLPANSYIVSRGITDTSVRLSIDGYNAGVWTKNIIYQAFTTDDVISIDYDGYDTVKCVIEIIDGTDITTPILFKPMLRVAEDADPTYQPYAKTNRELTEIAQKISSEMLINTEYETGEYFLGRKVYSYMWNTGFLSAGVHTISLPNSIVPYVGVEAKVFANTTDALMRYFTVNDMSFPDYSDVTKIYIDMPGPVGDSWIQIKYTKY